MALSWRTPLPALLLIRSIAWFDFIFMLSAGRTVIANPSSVPNHVAPLALKLQAIHLCQRAKVRMVRRKLPRASRASSNAKQIKALGEDENNQTDNEPY